MESIPFTNVWFYTSLPVSGALILLFVIRQELNVIMALFNRQPEQHKEETASS
jgi:TRAP-type C4-dicarboxylate transport system permease small subunit